jgi:hypothetical protein
VDVHGVIVTEAEQLPAAFKAAAINGSTATLEADHIFNPSQQGVEGGDCLALTPALLQSPRQPSGFVSKASLQQMVPEVM